MNSTVQPPTWWNELDEQRKTTLLTALDKLGSPHVDPLKELQRYFWEGGDKEAQKEKTEDLYKYYLDRRDEDDVMKVLKNPDKLQDFILKLKAVGKDSPIYKSQKNIMVSLGMNNTSPHVTQPTILQHAFKFCDLFECFETFRAVCKDWKSAVEKNRWDICNLFKIVKEYSGEPRYEYDSEYEMEMYGTLVQKPSESFPSTIHKALRSLKRIEIHVSGQWDEGRKLIVTNVKNLTSIKATEGGKGSFYKEPQKQFLRDLISNSKETLKELFIPDFNIPDVSLPNLETLKISYTEKFEDFETNFKTLIQNAPNLRYIHILKSDQEKLLTFEQVNPQYFDEDKSPFPSYVFPQICYY